MLSAADAEAGLTLARAEQPDLILMDIQLPGMDGLEATALLKQDDGDARHSGHRADRAGDEGRRGTHPGRGLRRLHRQAAALPGVPDGDLGPTGYAAGAMTTARRCRPRRHAAHPRDACVRARILIVDDERHNRQLLEIMLAPEGYVILTAASGEEALAIVGASSRPT